MIICLFGCTRELHDSLRCSELGIKSRVRGNPDLVPMFAFACADVTILAKAGII